MERAKGIEPSYAAWEAAVLPLNYARVVPEYEWLTRAASVLCLSSGLEMLGELQALRLIVRADALAV